MLSSWFNQCSLVKIYVQMSLFLQFVKEQMICMHCMHCTIHKNLMPFLFFVTLTFCRSPGQMSNGQSYALNTFDYFFMVIFRLNFFFLQDNYIGDVSFSKCVTSGGIYDCPLLAMLLLVIWLRWCIYLYVVSYIHINKSHSYCVCTQKLSIRTDCAAGGSRFPRLLGNPSNHVRSTASTS